MKHLLKHFKDLSIHPKNATELKGLILQLAVQGKLTANWRLENADVEPALVLLERIQAEKARLVKDKKIKKEKALPKITKEEVPYELPEGWTWCRLNEVCEYIQRGKSPKYSEVPKIPVVSQKCVQWSGFDISRAKFITEESLDKYGQERFLQEGDLLWNSTGDGTIGRVISFARTDFDRVVADSHVTVVRAFKQYLSTDYLWIFTASPLIQNLVAGRVSGSTKQTELGTGTVKLLEFSFPPLEEQKAIVSTVNTLFAEVEQLEALTQERIQLKEDFATSALQQLTNSQSINGEWAFLQQHFSTFFTELPNIKKLRESILQLAVQGKLTTHWRTHYAAIEDVDINRLEALRRAYQAEAASIKGQKSFKYKNSVKIDVGGKSKGVDSLFDIPSTWKWVSLGQIAWSINDGPHFSPKYVEEGVPMISGRNITFEKGIDFTTAKNVSENDHVEFTKRGKPDIGDVLLTKGGTTGVPCVVETSKEFSVWVHVALIKIIKEYVDPYYLKNALASPFVYRQSQEQTHGIGNKDLGLTRMIYFAIPLPPFTEQKAILAKVNTLMALCDRLEQEIQSGQSALQDWMKSSLRSVFEEKQPEAKTKDFGSELGMVAEPEEEYKNIKTKNN